MLMNNEAFTTILIIFCIFKIFFTIFLSVLLYRKHKKMRELLDFRNQTYGIIAHDLKSPYISYFKIIERLHKAVAEGNIPYANEQLDYLENSFYATKNILFNMMKWSQLSEKNQSQKHELTIISEFLNESIEHLIAYAKLNKISLQSHVNSNESVLISKHYVSAVLRNLIDNMIKHSDATQIDLNAEIKAKNLIIKIRHNGVNTPDEVRKSLLKQMKTNTAINRFGTMGLGLSIITKSLKKCGGSLQISQYENGESISVYFPIL